jgi:hypothetical protein
MICASAMIASCSDDNYRLHLFVINDKNEKMELLNSYYFIKSSGASGQRELKKEVLGD